MDEEPLHKQSCGMEGAFARDGHWLRWAWDSYETGANLQQIQHGQPDILTEARLLQQLLVQVLGLPQILSSHHGIPDLQNLLQAWHTAL